MSVKSIARKLASKLPEINIIKKFPDFKMGLLTSHSIDFKLLCGIGHEPDVTAAVRRLVKPGMNVVDVGANIGWVTLNLAAATGPSGNVTAFEPSQWTYNRLVQNVAMNTMPWVKTAHAAVGPSDQDKIRIQVPSGYRLDGKATETMQHMPMVRLDTALRGRIDFIKSDTDGYEAGVFEGANSILEKYRPTLLFEVADQGDDLQGMVPLLSRLQGIGYAFENMEGKSVDPFKEMETVRFPYSVNLVARSGI